MRMMDDATRHPILVMALFCALVLACVGILVEANQNSQLLRKISQNDRAIDSLQKENEGRIEKKTETDSVAPFSFIREINQDSVLLISRNVPSRFVLNVELGTLSVIDPPVDEDYISGITSTKSGNIILFDYDFEYPMSMTEVFDVVKGTYEYSIVNYWNGWLVIGTKRQSHTIGLKAECPETKWDETTFTVADGLLVDGVLVPFQTPLQTDCQVNLVSGGGGADPGSFSQYVFDPSTQTVIIEFHSVNESLKEVRKYTVSIDATNPTPSGIHITETPE